LHFWLAKEHQLTPSDFMPAKGITYIMSPSQLTRLLALNSEILKDGKYTDMTIKCGEAIFKLHKSIVCTQSKPLAAAFNGRFKESEDSTIILEDDEPEVFDAMVHFLYEQTLDLKETESNSLLLLIVKVSHISSSFDQSGHTAKSAVI
jgi:hypothetical protein